MKFPLASICTKLRTGLPMIAEYLLSSSSLSTSTSLLGPQSYRILTEERGGYYWTWQLIQCVLSTHKTSPELALSSLIFFR